MFGGICKTNPPSNASFLGMTPPSKAEETPKKDKTQATQMATREAKAESTPKKKKKFKYDRAKSYSAKTPLEDDYKIVVWDATKAYNPALEKDCVALDYLAATSVRHLVLNMYFLNIFQSRQNCLPQISWLIWAQNSA